MPGFRFSHISVAICLAIGGLHGLGCTTSRADIITFFNSAQIATPISTGVTSDTIGSEGYIFTYTRDKLFTGGLSGGPIGRPVSVNWPDGIQSQAVTAGPNPSKAIITIRRADGDVFDLMAFSAKLLANTFGAGGSFEVVPFLNGEEVLNDPIMFNASGTAGNVFSYNTSPNPQGSTALLKGYDKYTIDLYVDYALIGLTLQGTAMPEPSALWLSVIGLAGVGMRKMKTR